MILCGCHREHYQGRQPCPLLSWALEFPEEFLGEADYSIYERKLMDMKSKVLAITAGLALGMAAAGCARDKNATQAANGQYQNVTGSYVPQDVQKSGPVTNGKNNVRIIDRSEIDRSGGADVGQTLRQLGATH